jgi:AcrR family transcriptional regulator
VLDVPHRPGNRKAQLADAAAELFGKRGYHAVSVNDIACAAGVTGPAVYRHFGSKQDMLAHVLITGLEVFGQVTDEALADGLPKMLDAVAALAVERREITALWRWQGSHLDKEDRSTIRHSGKRTMDRWANSLVETRPELAADDAEMLAWAALSVFGSISVHHLTIPRKAFESLLANLAAAVFAYDGLPAPAFDDPGLPMSAPSDTTWRASGPLSRREELLAAATKLFRERGFRAVSMEDIGASAGIAGPSIYRHFASKADMLVAAGYRMADRLRIDAERAFAEATDPADALNRLTQSYVDAVLRTGNLMAIFVSEPIDMAERDAKELLRVQRSYVAEWVKLLIEIAPALGEREARITVHAALTIINDLSRTPRIAARPGIAAELVGLATTVLHASG